MEKKKILVRLPNWLGDMVMATAAVQQLPYFFPDAEVSVIAKKGIHELLQFFPTVQQQFIFSKDEYRGWKGLWQFGRQIRKKEKYDLFISFPDSFSSALIGYASGASMRIGYKKEGRNFLLTQSYTKPKGVHRVQEYIHLLEQYSGRKSTDATVHLNCQAGKTDSIVININSEASSRRLTVAKAVEMITAVRKEFSHPLLLIGSKAEQSFVEEVIAKLPNRTGIQSLAGNTSLTELCNVLASSALVLTTDSGPAHLANALRTQTIVLFGAGNENNTAPYNKQYVETVRLGKLSCEPCTKNVCVQFDTPQCLELLDTSIILTIMKQKMQIV